MTAKGQATVLVIWIMALWAFNLLDMHRMDPWILHEFRIPRLWGALLTGMGLALSGLMMQTLFRNPLAGPYLLGVTPGATLGMALYFLTGTLSGLSLSPWGAKAASLVGAFGALAIQLTLSKGFKSPLKMLLIGMVMSYVFSAGVQLLMQFSNAQDLQRYTFWGMGNFEAFKSGDSWYLWVPIIAVFSWVWIHRNALDTYLLGDIYVQSSNWNLYHIRIGLILGGALLAGWITSFAGPIGFVGLIAPHITKRLLKSESHHKVLVPSILWGGALCMSADTLAHHVMAHTVLPVNPICALIGAPILIYSLSKQRA